MPVKIGDVELYNIQELSELFGIGQVTLRRMFKDGRLKGRKMARRWYVTAENLREYFEESEQEGADV
jgi:excisionase family DNA binding protein